EDYWKSTQQLRAGIGSARRLVDIPEWPAERRHEIFLGQMEDLPERLGGYFDIAFSMACFEHIHHLGLALEKMYAALRPGGRLLSMFSPIWSAYDGHHLPQILDEEGRDIRKSILPHIPPWGHLLLSPPDMYHHLKREGLSSELASRAVYAIYYHPQINRLKTEDYARYIALSPFKIVQLIGTYPTQMTPEMTSALKQKYPGYTNFSNNGILALLEKPL
ncbi:MAG TPA: class I SAM-dependent methyltransferase, partial [Opitutales bacterium]|nr:class I SAM-dependent methyltransferase [Opitutales bacterium]